MALTTQQQATLKAAILADPVLDAYPNTADGAYDMTRDRLNVEASPVFVIWDYSMTEEKMAAGILIGATQIDGLTPGKRDELFWIVGRTRDASDPAVRAAIDDACGNANTLKNALIGTEKRNALLGEKILATGTGTTQAPATAVYRGTLNYQDVQAARNS